ncbi:hypothetical protein BJ742DRAFT_841453 [Cladochytrium replicatum]|nr:hypothetical protein BJ742DRAFT_841453 [Cladochytrium replicatum]
MASTVAVMAIAAFLAIVQVANAANLTMLCKCSCNRITVLAVDICNDCTKRFCVEKGACEYPPGYTPPNTSALLANVVTSGYNLLGQEPPSQTPIHAPSPDHDWHAICFQRGSVKDEAIVWSFLIILSVLLIGAAAKPYIFKFFTSLQDHIQSERRWWNRQQYSHVGNNG